MRWQILLCLLLFTGLTITGHAQDVSCAGAPESRLVIGEQATVIVLGGSNLRDFPSVTGSLLDVLPVNTRVPVLEGPFCSEGYAWWRVQHAGRRGWLAEGTDDNYWLRPYLIVRAQMATYRVETIPELSSGFDLSRRENDYTFTLRDYPLAERTARLRVSVRVPAIAQAEQARCVLAGRDDCFDDAIVAHFTPLSGIDGYRYLTLTESDQQVIYHMRAIIAEGEFVQLDAPLALADTLATPPPEDTASEEDIAAYRVAVSDELNVLPDDTFTPDLQLLDLLALSLRTDQSLLESDLFRYESAVLAFDYNPYLTHDIITLEDDLAALAWRLRGYPVNGEALIRLVDPATTSSNTLAQLQMTLGREPRTPPILPLIAESSPTVSQDHVAYLAFQNGQAVRRVIVDEQERHSYHLQGLTDTADMAIDIRLPLESTPDGAYHPPLAVLDTLARSLIVNASAIDN